MGSWLEGATWRGRWPRASPAPPRPDRGQAGQVPLCLRPYADPVLRIKPGDIVVAETHDVRGEDQPRERQAERASERAVPQPAMRSDRGRGGGEGRRARGLHPQIAPARPQPIGTTALITEFGGPSPPAARPAQPAAAGAGEEDGGDRAGHRLQQKITLPYEPFIGTLGVSPRDRGVTSLQPDYWGGNMDLPDVAPGRSSTFRSTTRTPTFTSATAMRPRATASCAASRSRCRRPRPCRST